jgi:hypothetical protein
MGDAMRERERRGERWSGAKVGPEKIARASLSSLLCWAEAVAVGPGISGRDTVFASSA